MMEEIRYKRTIDKMDHQIVIAAKQPFGNFVGTKFGDI